VYDRILLPTDGNPKTPQVVRHALSVAELSDGVVHVVSVAASHGDEAARGAIDDAVDLAERRGVPTKSAVLDGRPYEAILEYADEVDVDMIVMGTHGRSGLDRFMLGSVTERVLRTANVPVLAIRLDDGGSTVTDAETAQQFAREALEGDGHDVAGFPEQPYRESNTWIVRATTDDDVTYNVHVQVASGETRLAKIES